MVLEPEGSSPYSQQPATSTYPESTGSTLHSPANLPKINSDPILPSTPRPSELSPSFGRPHQNLVHFSVLSSACHMSRPPQSPWFLLPNDIWRWVQNMKLLIVQLHSPVASSFFGPNILFRTLFSNTLSLCSSLSLRDQVSHPYKTLT
jgi:hypothetical protein